MNEYTCPNGCDLLGDPIPQEAIDAVWYGPGVTHFNRRVGLEVRGVYDGVLIWYCPDCDVKWPRFGKPDWRHKEAMRLIAAKEA